MIVKNEEVNLPRTLASVAGLDAELVVVDTGSTDRTADIAREHGARVVSFAWVDDFSAARNFAFENATGAWMLVLDADEELTSELRADIARVLDESRADGIRIPVACVDDGGRLQRTLPSVRIVRNGRGHRYENRVHEDVEAPILRAGGVIEDADLPLVHRGYTAAETVRKGRHERNLRLVVAEHEASPQDPRYWHYLGLEHAIAGDYTRAAPWFERVVNEHPEHSLAGWSASQLVAIRVSERAFGAAWDAARVGIDKKLGRVQSLVLLGDLAIREGDAKTALACADALDETPDEVAFDIERRRETSVVLRAKALAELGSVRDAYALLVRAVAGFPSDGLVADELVKLAERVHPPARAGVVAVRDTAGAPSVIAATIGSFVRARAWAPAVEVGDRYGFRSEYLAHALLRVGRANEARAVLTAFGESASIHVVLHALERRDERALADGLAALPKTAASLAAAALAGRRAPPSLRWMVTDWMQVALAYRADAVAELLARCLPGSDAERAATHAILLYEAGEPMRALTLALEHLAQPDAAEVVGLVAFDKGDMSAAATLLGARVRTGDVSVRVVMRACAALKKAGHLALAREMLEAGRASRPHARLQAA